MRSIPESFKGRVSEDEVGALLSSLVAIPSVNPQHENLLTPPFGEGMVADFVENFGQSIGLTVARQAVLPGRENVLLTIPGKDRSRRLLFECHMDTVPGWEGPPDPFVPRIEGGLLFGRGSCDVKGTLASMLEALRLIVSSSSMPPRDVVLAAVVDEEHQARGVSHLAGIGPPAEAAIVGEPTGLSIVIAHKGCVRWRIATAGRSVHSSKAYLGQNAIDEMVDLLYELRGELIPRLSQRSHPLVGAPSLSICTIHGGVAVNVIPDRCEIEVDRRTVPGEKVEPVIAEVEDQIRSIAAKRGLTVHVEPPFVVDPALDTPPNAAIVSHLTWAAKQITGSSRLIGVPFGTDASKLSLMGIPTVVFGPGDIDVAHTKEEHVRLAEVARAAEILATLALSTPPIP